MTTGEERKIIVAVDEGEESMYALSWCLKNIVNTRNSNDSLLLLYAKPPRPQRVTESPIFIKDNAEGYMVTPDVLASIYGTDLSDRIMRKAKKMCRDQFSDMTVVTRVETGQPVEVICQVTEELGLDALLVIGSHGHGPIRSALFGSMSNDIALNVKCPVLIVKRPQDYLATLQVRASPFHTFEILVTSLDV